MTVYQNRCDVAVIGAGHAGVEAALAAARLGLDTVLFTLSLDSVANMPCNPAIGGTGKGHLVYEIDALGGEMGKAADAATIQSRTLNESRGSAVHSKRVQTDRAKYKEIMLRTLERQEHLRLVQAEITGVEAEDGKICAVTTRLGVRWETKAAVISSGTYLGGVIHVGSVNFAAGPDGSLPATALTESLRALGIKLMRFKTGTPVRVSARTVDTSVLERQDGETVPVPFSALTPDGYLDGVDQKPCHIVYTNSDTHKVILDNIHRSALYSGNISGVGPRYCPSIEDKLVRFADKERHQLFVEPIGDENDELYIGGFSTSLPSDVQEAMLRTLPGFADAHITRNAYAIEYDCCDPTELDAALGFKNIKGLYGAGQFNGTSGYEEAAAQGLVAGANAALYVLGREPMLIGRSTSYIGIMIDDLITKGTREPYRIMTSRSEYRLYMRQDNADDRLTEIGRKAGTVSDERYAKYQEKRDAVEAELYRLSHTGVAPTDEVNALLAEYGSAPISAGARLDDLLRRPELDYSAIERLDPAPAPLSRSARRTVETNVKYEGYIKKQLASVQRARSRENLYLPKDLDYSSIRGLRIEAAQKLASHRPHSVGEAAGLAGVNPADISVLLLYLDSLKRKENDKS